MKDQEIRKEVRERYAKAAKQSDICCAPTSCGCGASNIVSRGKAMGYTEAELKAIPDGANLGLGCGNPVAMASLKKGEVVLDLGSGAGVDCFLAANRVGVEGKVIGVDMTAEMLEKARANAAKGKYTNVEFRLGEIENLPVADSSVDAIISNCVINLSPDKPRVFREAFRVLKPGGRVMVSDIVLLGELPDLIKNSIEAYVHCLSGALSKDDYLSAIKSAGFRNVKVIQETGYPVEWLANEPLTKDMLSSLNLSMDELAGLAKSIVSAKVHATKPVA